MSRKEVSEKGWCVYCGIQAPSGALYCPRCGEPIDQSYLYSESLSSEDAIAEEREETREKPSIKIEPVNVFQINLFPPLYEGVIHGLVTGELTTSFMQKKFFFIMKLGEGFEGVPNEVLVSSEKPSYLRIGDKVALHGKIIKVDLKKGGSPSYIIQADQIYNETLNIGDEGLVVSKKVIYKGMIQGSVTEEPRINTIYGIKAMTRYFLMKLDENMGIAEVPEEILVHYKKLGYFGKGDKLFLHGKIFRINLNKIDRPMYVIEADHYYNETLQCGDEPF